MRCPIGGFSMGITDAILGHEQNVQAGLDYLELVERETPKLIDAMPDRIPNDLIGVMVYLKKALSLAAALRRYPVFDPSCLSSLKKQAVRLRNASVDAELWLPRFAWGQISGYSAPVITICAGHLSDFGETPLRGRFDVNIVTQNRAIIERELRGIGGFSDDRLSAAPPAIPAPARSKIDEVGGIFDHLHLIWEAQWTAAPVADPLLVGTIDEHCFLVYEYDATKAEHYVAREYCRKAKTE